MRPLHDKIKLAQRRQRELVAKLEWNTARLAEFERQALLARLENEARRPVPPAESATQRALLRELLELLAAELDPGYHHQPAQRPGRYRGAA